MKFDDALSRVAWQDFEVLVANHYRDQGYDVLHCGDGQFGRRGASEVDLRMLDRLEAKGLLKRVRSAEDRRIVHLELTTEGERVSDLIPFGLSKVLNEHLEGFSKDEFTQLQSLLRRMAKRTPPTSQAGRRQLEALGARLRAARLRREMSQAALAEKVGVHVQTILKLESGNPATSLATMLLVLKALGMSADIDAIAAGDTQ